MSAFLEYFNMTVVACAATFAATLIFSQKLKDFFNGVPSHLRSGLSSVEAGIIAQVKTYEADLVGKIIPTPAPVAKPVVPAPPAAPAA